jgi:hypothetical protein
MPGRFVESGDPIYHRTSGWTSICEVEGGLKTTNRRPTPKAQTSAPRTFTTEYYNCNE